MRVCHSFDTVFDDPNLIAYGGLPAVMALAEKAGLHALVDHHVTVPDTAGANAAVKVSALIAGMVAGADSISDLDVLRHGGMGRVFTGLRAATTLGTRTIVLYDTEVGAGARLAPLSLVMKGERIPGATAWTGVPARPDRGGDPPTPRRPVARSVR